MTGTSILAKSDISAHLSKFLRLSGRAAARSALVGVLMIFWGTRDSRALEFELYGMDLFVDSTVSVGVSVRVAKRDPNFLPEANGGPREQREVAARTHAAAGDTTPLGTRYLATATGGGASGAGNFEPAPRFQITNDGIPFNFDDSISTDDSRLNFDQGDLISAPLKMTNDILLNVGDFGRFGNYSAFARITSFYDEVLGRRDLYEREGIYGTPAKRLAARDVELLDAYVSGDYELLGEALNVRLGKQVISWGESTFYLGGINVVNPIDVSSFRRPGAEVKDVLLPENALYASLSLPYNLNFEVYYLLEWNPFELEPPGTPFQNTDPLSHPTAPYQDRLYYSGSATTGTYRLNCSGSPARRDADRIGGGVEFPVLPGGDTEGSCKWAYDRERALLATAATTAQDGALVAPAQAIRTAQQAYTAALNVVNMAVAGGTTPTAQQLQAVGVTQAGLTSAINNYNALYNEHIGDRLSQNIRDYRTKLYDYAPGRAEFVHRDPFGTNPLGLFPDGDNAILPRYLGADGMVGGTGVNTDETDEEWRTRVQNSALYKERYLDRQTELNTGRYTGETNASDDGQYGLAVRWYSDFFNGTEFGLYYQNYHSRRPVARVRYSETPYVTIAKTGWTSSGGAALQAIGCAPGSFLAVNPALAAFASVLPTVGFLPSGSFLDPDIKGTQDTTGAPMETFGFDGAPITGLGSHTHFAVNSQGVRATTATPRMETNPDSFRLQLDPAAFREAGIQTEYWDPTGGTDGTGARVMEGRILPGLNDYLKYARYADHVFNTRATQGIAAGSNSATGQALIGTSGGVGGTRLAVRAATLVALGATPGSATAEQGRMADAAAAMVMSNIEDSAKKNGPNRYDVARINCALAITQVAAFTGDAAGATNPAGSAAPFSNLAGAEFLGIQHRNELYYYYPEDIKSLGISFATTFGDWGVQGEVALRMDQPLQVDTTEQIISVAGQQATANSLGDAHRIALVPLGTQDIADFVPDSGRSFAAGDIIATATIPGVGAVPLNFGGIGASQRSVTPDNEVGMMTRQGIVQPPSAEFVDMISAQLAFTNTFTRSTGIVDALGGDLSIFLVNFALEHVISMPDARSPITRPVPKHNTLISVCRSGTELPLGSILNLDTVTDYSCSPDETSFGYTIFANMQYNNVGGTAWQMTPFIALRHDVVGNTPTPISTFREDRVAVTLGVNGEYQSEWRFSLSYTDFFGEENYQANGDRDFLSLSLTYSF